MTKILLQIIAGVAAVGSAFAYDASATSVSYEQGATFSGAVGVWEITHGRIGLTRRPKLLGYFGGGHARYLGLGCEGHDNPLVGIFKDNMKNCRQVIELD